MTDSEVRGDGESWEDYARRLERRVKQQREHINALQTIHSGKGNKADRKRLRALEATLGSMTLRWERQREATHALADLLARERARAADVDTWAGSPESAQRALSTLTARRLSSLMADVVIAVAYLREDGASPHQVLRDAHDVLAWPESEWPEVRKVIEEWLAAPAEPPESGRFIVVHDGGRWRLRSESGSGE